MFRRSRRVRQQHGQLRPLIVITPARYRRLIVAVAVFMTAFYLTHGLALYLTKTQYLRSTCLQVTLAGAGTECG